jgi:hypothetical protein
MFVNFKRRVSPVTQLCAVADVGRASADSKPGVFGASRAAVPARAKNVDPSAIGRNCPSLPLSNKQLTCLRIVTAHPANISD